jgi:hypothetical protein
MPHPIRLALIAFVTLTLTTAHAADLRILQADPFELPLAAQPDAKHKPRSQTLVSVAGRQFELELKTNDRLLRSIPAEALAAVGKHELYRGEIAGVPGSWVRLSRINGRTYGAVWDGIQLYAVGPREQIEAKMEHPIMGKSTDAAIFRWADTEGGDLQACGLAKDQVPAGGQYRAIIRELKTLAATSSTQQIEVAVIGDYEFYTLFGAQSVATMLERMNVVDGIFASQVGVSIVPTDFKVFDTATDPFTSTSASTLLDEVASYKSATPIVRSRGLAHLMTGRNLDGNTVGIAVMGSLCQPRVGVSLSQASNGSFAAPLIAAHELGHNFGAPHDGEAECASAPSGFLMAPSINGSSQFSECSLQQMKPVVNAAPCVTAYLSPDAGVSFPGAPFRAGIDESFDIPIDISSPGDGAVQDLKVTAILAGAIEGASLDGTGCEIEGATVKCRIAQLASHETRRLTVRTHLTERKTFNISASLSAWQDDNNQNDSAATTLEVGAAESPTTPPPAQPAPPASVSPAATSKGGGGGAFELLSLLGTLGLLGRRRQRLISRR